MEATLSRHGEGIVRVAAEGADGELARALAALGDPYRLAGADGGPAEDEGAAGGDPAVLVLGPAALGDAPARAVRRARLRRPGPAIVAVPAAGAPALAVRDLFRAGAADVVLAEELPDGLRAALDRTLARREAMRAAELESARLACELGARARELERALRDLERAYDQTLHALVSALDCREHETASHSQRVAGYAVFLALWIGYPEDRLVDLYRGALLHDLGKIAIPDAILLKPGKLDPDEWTVMRTHAERGAAIVEAIDFLRGAAEVPRCHHESWDGSGYPRGLRGEAIPLAARIFACVDVYDALRSWRPYKEPWSHEEAIAEMRRVAGTRLDPGLVAAFEEIPEATWDALAKELERAAGFPEVLEICRRHLER